MYSKPVKTLSIAQEELRGISRTVAEIEWLLLILVLLYQVFEGPPSTIAWPSPWGCFSTPLSS